MRILTSPVKKVPFKDIFQFFTHLFAASDVSNFWHRLNFVLDCSPTQPLVLPMFGSLWTDFIGREFQLSIHFDWLVENLWEINGTQLISGHFSFSQPLQAGIFGLFAVTCNAKA